MRPDLVIRPEAPDDHRDVFRVNASAFPSDDEAKLVDALRDGGYARISLVAAVEGQTVGHLLFSALDIETANGAVPALSLAPMAVLPDWQRQGIGSQLVERGLAAAREQGHRIVIVLGHPEFYRRFGFSSELARPLMSPFSGDVWMAMEVEPKSLSGVAGTVRYPEPFGLS